LRTSKLFTHNQEFVMNVNRTTLFAALLAAGIATGAVAQYSQSTPSTGKATATAPAGDKDKAAAPSTGAAGTTSPTATPAPPSAGSTGMDKGAGTAATTGTSKTAQSSSLSRSERRFIEKTLEKGMQDVELSKLALDKAQNPQVKELAKRLVEDHPKANAELMKLATAKGVTPPAAVDASHKRKIEKMSKKSGRDFDRDYADEMEDDHSKEVREFRSMAKSAKDPDVKAFAASTLPTLEQHLQLAKAAESAVKKSKTTTAGSSSSTMSAGSTSGTTSSSASSPAAPAKDAATSGTSSAASTPAKGSASDTKTTSPPK
jgi:putative membrane protein